MAELERIGISLDKDLLSEFDALIARQGYQSRSEAVRDLVRQQLSQERLGDPKSEAVAAVFLVYDHHARNLQAKLTDIQHDSEGLIVSVMHVHLSHHDCLEVLVVRGAADKVRGLADRLAAVRGVTHGKLTITTTEHKK